MSVIMFCVEVMIMGTFQVFDFDIHGIWAAIIDSLILIAFAGPTIYVWTIKPYITAQAQADEERISAHERAQKIVNSATEAIITIDEQQDIISFNKASEHIFGYTVGEALGQPLSILLPKGAIDRHAAWVDEYSSSLETQKRTKNRREIYGRHKNGTEFVAEGSITRQDTPDGVECTVILQDITARKQAGQALRESEARFKDFAFSSADWFWEMGPDLCFTYLSDRFSEITGLSAESILGKTRKEIAAPDVQDEAWVYHLEDLDAHKPFKDFRYAIKRKDDELAHFSISGIPVFGGDGAFQGYRGTATDVSEAMRSVEQLNREVLIRKEAEDLLRKELEENRLLIEVIEESSIGLTISEVKNNEYPLVYCNKAFTDACGYSIEEVKGKDLFFLFGPDTGSDAWKILDEAIEHRQRTTLEVLCYKKDGTTFWNNITLFSIYDKDADTTSLVSIQVDVTERIKMREEKENMLLRAMESSKTESLGTLAGGIAHEINTPVQYIGDNIMFLQNEAINFFALLDCYEDLYAKAKTIEDLSGEVEHVDQKQQKMDIEFLREEVPLAISQSLDGVGKVANIVKAVKEFSHPGSQEMQRVSINDLIDNVTTITRNQWKYVANLKTDLAEDLPLVECNPNELNQVFVNLIINASQAIEELDRNELGNITISTVMLDHSVEIKISDDGPGISKLDQDRIFDLFFTTKPPGQGTGQGLAICHNIINNHKGTLGVESETGKGTTFVIVLPQTQGVSA